MFSNSTLGVLLKALPRDEIQELVNKHGSDRWRKSFGTWDHLVAMLTGQFSGARSLREVETVLAGHANHHYHLGIGAIRRSTLSDANAGRSSAVFRDIVQMMISRAGRAKRTEIRSVLSILDASHIRLSGLGYDWAKKTRTRGTCYGLKLHVQMDADDERLEYSDVTPTNVNDLVAAWDFPLEAGRTYVFDKGYCDYNWWHEIIQAGSHFVTRLKHNGAKKVIENNPINSEDEGFILSDQVIELTNRSPRAGKINRLAGTALRLIQIKHPGGKSRPFQIVSSNVDVSAATIAAIYKKRWAVELLFKWIKQNLKIKRFIGQSRNAVMIQIFVALIAYILLKMFKNLLGNAAPHRLRDLLVTIQHGLFHRPEMFQRRQKYWQKTFENQQKLWEFTP